VADQQSGLPQTKPSNSQAQQSSNLAEQQAPVSSVTAEEDLPFDDMPADVSGPPSNSLADPLPSEPEDYGEPDEELFDDMVPDVPAPNPTNQNINGSDVVDRTPSVSADKTEANYKRYTVYELEKHWGAVIEDYNTIDAMMGGYLRLASIRVGEYTQSPFPVTVVFPASLSHFFDSRKDSFVQSLQEYLEIVLQRTIDLEIKFDDSNKSEELRRIERQSLGVEQIFQEDVKREPVLKKLVELFEAERRLTQREKKKV